MRRVLVLAGFVLAACGGRGETPRSEEGRAPAPAVEGAFCNEHGVLEAVCTKCNPALIAVFQAKGDWCAEHGFPESICPTCHPERGGRPSTDVSADDGPADGTKVRLKRGDTASMAGLQTATVEARSSAAAVVAVARIVYDGTKVAQINARSSGVVRALRADVGARVEEGAPLVVIESAGVGADQSRLLASRSRVEAARTNLAREQDLRSKGIASDRQVLAAQQELAIAQADHAAAMSALGMVGATVAGGRYTLSSPLSGVVTRRTATVGTLVDSEEMLFEVVDTSSMWAEIDVAESDAPRVAAGQVATLSVDGLGERAITGTIDYVAPEIDPRTRTVRARVSLPNPDGALRANMFARARIAVTAPEAVLFVPRSAVQRAKTVQLVFARLTETLYEARRVHVGAADGELVEVSGRLRAGEQVVTEGSFLLKTETLKGSIGAGCCD